MKVKILNADVRVFGNGVRYGIKLTEQPWYYTYNLIRQIIYWRTRRGTLNEDFVGRFDKEFEDWITKVISGEKTHQDLEKWLEEQHEWLQTPESGKRLPGLSITKPPRYTQSGFEVKPRSLATYEERAVVIIDNLIEVFTPTFPKELEDEQELIEKYQEDWKQELWRWCWENRETDPNLNSLIVNYHRNAPSSYKLASSRFLSRMNSYIVPYILKLKYSCNDIPVYTWSNGRLYNWGDRYKTEISYSTDEEPKYVSEDDLDEMIIANEEKKLVEELLDNLATVPYSSRHLSTSGIRYKKVLQMRYGLNSENRIYTLQEIGDCLGITKERVRQIENKALCMLRTRMKINNKRSDDLF